MLLATIFTQADSESFSSAGVGGGGVFMDTEHQDTFENVPNLPENITMGKD